MFARDLNLGGVPNRDLDVVLRPQKCFVFSEHLIFTNQINKFFLDVCVHVTTHDPGCACT